MKRLIIFLGLVFFALGIKAQIELGTIVSLQSDTTIIYSFGLGAGNAGDTAVFIDDAIIGAFYNDGSDTIVVTSLLGVIETGSGSSTIDVQGYFNDTLLTTYADIINTSALTVTSTTTGDVTTTFTNDEIPPGMWIWCVIDATVGSRPSLLSLSMIGHKRNLSY